MVVPTCFFIAAWSCKCEPFENRGTTNNLIDSLCVNYVPYYRDVVDSVGSSEVGIRSDAIVSPDDVEKGSVQEVEKAGAPNVDGHEVSRAGTRET